MTRQADCKRRVRARMARTGESIRQFTERDQVVEANRDRKHVLWFEAGLYD